MANMKKMTEVEEIASVTENTKVFINENDSLRQVPAKSIGAQSDWNEEDPSNPAFIMNKPDLSNVGGGGGAAHYWASVPALCLHRGDKIGSDWTHKLTQAEIADDFANGVIRLNGNSTILGYRFTSSDTQLYTLSVHTGNLTLTCYSNT